MADGFYQRFHEATNEAFYLISKALKVRTFFVGKTTEKSFSVVKVSNQGGSSIEEGDHFPIQDSY